MVNFLKKKNYMSIEVNNVSKFYGRQSALDDVSFEVNPGDIVGFLGPNGAGKSTMMKIITGFISANTGIVTVNGYKISDYPTYVKRSIGYLPESNPLYLEMFVAEYLEFVAGMYELSGNKKTRVKDIIQKTGLYPERNKTLAQLSKGFRQRIGIAQALIHEPEVLILDEPTTGLDPNQIVEIRNLISSVGTEKTVMLSTHIMQEVEAICDRVIIINDGRIVANDFADNLQNLAKETKQEIFVEFMETVSKEELEGIDEAITVYPSDTNQWIIENGGDTDIRPKISQFARDKNLTLLAISQKEQRLESIFRELTDV